MADTLFDRNTYVTFDSNGNDPLSDKLLGKLSSVPYVNTHFIQKCDEFRPDKLAAKLFGDSRLYWVILEYNRLSSFTDLIAGESILVPDQTALNSLLLASNTKVSTKTLYIK
jgi:hypothetical protein